MCNLSYAIRLRTPIGTYVYVGYLAYGSKHNKLKFIVNSAVPLNGRTREKLHFPRIFKYLVFTLSTEYSYMNIHLGSLSLDSTSAACFGSVVAVCSD